MVGKGRPRTGATCGRSLSTRSSTLLRKEKSHVVSSSRSQKASELEKIGVSGEKSLLLLVSPCRGGSTAAREERTDQPNHKVSLKHADPQKSKTSLILETQIIYS